MSKYYDSNSQAYLEPSQISMMEHFCKNSQELEAFNCFHKKIPSYMFEKVLITPR